MVTFTSQKPWSDDIRTFLLHAAWRYHHNHREMRGYQKMKWVIEMDDPRNSSAFVNVSNDSFVIELGFERIVDDTDVSAGKRIRIEDFYIFRTIFDQA